MLIAHTCCSDSLCLVQERGRRRTTWIIQCRTTELNAVCRPVLFFCPSGNFNSVRFSLQQPHRLSMMQRATELLCHVSSTIDSLFHFLFQPVSLMEKRSFLAYLHMYNAVAHIVPCRTSLTRQWNLVIEMQVCICFISISWQQTMYDAVTHIEASRPCSCKDGPLV